MSDLLCMCWLTDLWIKKALRICAWFQNTHIFWIKEVVSILLLSDIFTDLGKLKSYQKSYMKPVLILLASDWQGGINDNIMCATVWNEEDL